MAKVAKAAWSFRASALRIAAMSEKNPEPLAKNSPERMRELRAIPTRRKSGPRSLMEPYGVAWELAGIYRQIKRKQIDSGEGVRRAMVLQALAKVLDSMSQREFEQRLLALEALLSQSPTGTALPRVRDLLAGRAA